ncbi:MAG: twin-arginine translocation signal domain-containing protein [Chloroflexi bacterium]|nr:twin-arginine translocation signal domain-containing protein [Chloroflexota bacterium]
MLPTVSRRAFLQTSSLAALGLLLDLVATGQQEQVEQAYERYLALYRDYA